MSKKQTSRVSNPMSKKHEKNKREKARRADRANYVVLCAICGKPDCSCNAKKVAPDDPGYVNVIARSKGLTSKKARKSAKPIPAHVPLKPAIPKKHEPLVIPDFLAAVAKRMAEWAAISLDDLEYRGRSKRMGTKAGRKRVAETHCFVVKNPVILPVQPTGDVVELWHGSPLANTSGILTGGLQASVSGMLGPGVYLGQKAKALKYALKGTGCWGLMLYCRVDLGMVVSPGQDCMVHDTIYCPSGVFRRAWGGSLRMGEWCVRDPNRVTVLELHLVPRILLVTQ